MASEAQFKLLLEKFDRLETRLEALETRPAVPDQQPHPPQPTDDTQEPQGYARSEPIQESTERASPSPNLDSLSRQFDHIRERLNKVAIPSSYKLHDSPIGIKQDLKPALKVISKTARHAETGLKLIANLTTPDNETADGNFVLTAPQAQDIFTIFGSQLAFLQAEYSALVVKSTFNAETSRLFRSFENNSSAFSDSSLRNIRIAAELSAIGDRNSNRGGSTFSRGMRGARGFRGRRMNTYYRGNPNMSANDIPHRPPQQDNE